MWMKSQGVPMKEIYHKDFYLKTFKKTSIRQGHELEITGLVTIVYPKAQ